MFEQQILNIIKQVENLCNQEVIYKDTIGSIEKDDLHLRFQIFTSQAERIFLSLNEEDHNINWGDFYLCEAYLCDEDNCGYFIIHLHVDEDAYEEQMLANIAILKELDFELKEIITEKEKELVMI